MDVYGDGIIYVWSLGPFCVDISWHKVMACHFSNAFGNFWGDLQGLIVPVQWKSCIQSREQLLFWSDPLKLKPKIGYWNPVIHVLQTLYKPYSPTMHGFPIVWLCFSILCTYLTAYVVTTRKSSTTSDQSWLVDYDTMGNNKI